jgi:O-antigen/teichoic acid export membrane protein
MKQVNRPANTADQAVDAAQVPGSRKIRGSAATFTRNSTMNVGRLAISAAVGFLLPTFLIHRLPITTYSAWVLILQMSAYVGYLDFGIQSGISKYVAEFEARNDPAGSSMRASAGLALLLMVSLLGVILTMLLVWRAPSFFHEMPVALYADMRLGLAFVGISASFGLLSSIFASIFTGLQRFAVPTVIALANRLLFVAVVLASVYFHGSLATMGGLVALVNIASGLVHFVAWRRMAKHVRLSLYGLDYSILKKMLAYCSSLAVWTVAMLCISGLDVTIVGRYDFPHTAFYSIATTPTNLMIAIMGAALAPLLPAASALSVHRSAVQMGDLLSRATRYTSNLLIVSGVPLLVGGYWLLRFWVGSSYAIQIVGYMRILVLANVVRNMCAPYANMLIATESQKIAIAGACAEAIVNLSSSIYLARHIGAIGVAYGTLLGSFVGVGMHFLLNMHYTYAKFAITRRRLFLSGIARPLTIALPSIVLVKLWWQAAAPSFGLRVWLAWGLSSLLLAWFVGLDPAERASLLGLARSQSKWAGARINPVDPLG